MKISVQGKVKTRIVYARSIDDVKAGRYLIVKERPWEKNLMLDKGLNALARSSANGLQCHSVGCFTFAQVGGGTNPNSIASGAVTFTQVGTTITASSSFFTAAMVGGIFKYGTGSAGTEQYIVSQTGTACVVSGAGQTVAAPTVATVWQVQQAALQTPLFQTNTYQTVTGDCSTTSSGANLIQQRTFIIAQQASPYTVNEIGYSSISGTGNCLGRIKLSSSDVVGVTNFYVIVLQLTFTFSPGVPTAVGDVGTNINTAGNAMVESFSPFNVANINGANGNLIATNFSLEGGGAQPLLGFITEAYSQNGSPNLGTQFAVTNVVAFPAQPWTFDGGGAIGRMTATFAASTTTSGQSCTGICILNQVSTNKPCFDVKLTTPVTLPNGTFQPNTVWQCVYGRTLVN